MNGGTTLHIGNYLLNNLSARTEANPEKKRCSSKKIFFRFDGFEDSIRCEGQPEDPPVMRAKLERLMQSMQLQLRIIVKQTK